MNEEAQPHETLNAALNAVMGDIGYLQKKARNDFNKYTYLSDEDIMKAAQPAMVRHGVIIMPGEVSHELHDAGETSRGSSQTRCVATVRWDIVHAHSDGERSCVTIGEGVDAGDKACYKALTGARKYLFRLLFSIPTGDEPDRDSPTGRPPSRNNRSAPKQPREKRTERRSGKAPQASGSDDSALERWLAKLDKLSNGTPYADGLLPLVKTAAREVGLTKTVKSTLTWLAEKIQEGSWDPGDVATAPAMQVLRETDAWRQAIEAKRKKAG